MEKTTQKKKYFVVRERAVPEAESCTGKEITGFREGKHGTGSSRADRDQSKLLL